MFMPAQHTDRLPNGTSVIACGEPATIIGGMRRLIPGERIRYMVEFADRTTLSVSEVDIDTADRECRDCAVTNLDTAGAVAHIRATGHKLADR